MTDPDCSMLIDVLVKHYSLNDRMEVLFIYTVQTVSRALFE